MSKKATYLRSYFLTKEIENKTERKINIKNEDNRIFSSVKNEDNEELQIIMGAMINREF